MIRVQDLVKHYKVHSRPPGLGAALRSLLKREYKTVKAVDGLSFSIAPGERVGFLGPNGAGKTTTLKVLAGLLHPSDGSVEVAGFAPHRRDPEFLRSIMLVTGQKQQLLWDLPPSETFELNRAIYDVPRAEYKQTLDELVDLLGLEKLIRMPTRPRFRCWQRIEHAAGRRAGFHGTPRCRLLSLGPTVKIGLPIRRNGGWVAHVLFVQILDKGEILASRCGN